MTITFWMRSWLGALVLGGVTLGCGPGGEPAAPGPAWPSPVMQPAPAQSTPGEAEPGHEVELGQEAGPEAEYALEGEQGAEQEAEAAEALPSQCAEEEATVFGCVLESGAVLSVCASEPVGASGGYVQVRVGPLGQPNVVFPSEEQGREGLVFDRYTRPQVTYTRLYVQQDGGRYEVFDEFHHGETARGLKIARPGRAEASDACTEPVTGTLLVLEDAL